MSLLSFFRSRIEEWKNVWRFSFLSFSSLIFSLVLRPISRTFRHIFRWIFSGYGLTKDRHIKLCFWYQWELFTWILVFLWTLGNFCRLFLFILWLFYKPSFKLMSSQCCSFFQFMSQKDPFQDLTCTFFFLTFDVYSSKIRSGLFVGNVGCNLVATLIIKCAKLLPYVNHVYQRWR